jgi:hypothetical protein
VPGSGDALAQLLPQRAAPLEALPLGSWTPDVGVVDSATPEPIASASGAKPLGAGGSVPPGMRGEGPAPDPETSGPVSSATPGVAVDPGAVSGQKVDPAAAKRAGEDAKAAADALANAKLAAAAAASLEQKAAEANRALDALHDPEDPRVLAGEVPPEIREARALAEKALAEAAAARNRANEAQADALRLAQQSKLSALAAEGATGHAVGAVPTASDLKTLKAQQGLLEEAAGMLEQEARALTQLSDDRDELARGLAANRPEGSPPTPDVEEAQAAARQAADDALEAQRRAAEAQAAVGRIALQLKEGQIALQNAGGAKVEQPGVDARSGAGTKTPPPPVDPPVDPAAQAILVENALAITSAANHAAAQALEAWHLATGAYQEALGAGSSTPAQLSALQGREDTAEQAYQAARSLAERALTELQHLVGSKD